MASPHGGEIKRFCDFLLSPFLFLFFCFLGQLTSRNFIPNCTLNGSKVVFRLIHVPFGVWCLQIHYQGVSGPKNRQIVTRKSLDLKVTFMIDHRKLQTKISFLVMVVQPDVYFSSWRLPPSWISKNVCHFFTIRPIITKFSRQIATLI